MKAPWPQPIDMLLSALYELERHCPCGARPESLLTHPHASACPVEGALFAAGQLRQQLTEARQQIAALQRLAWNAAIIQHHQNSDSYGYGCKDWHDGKFSECKHTDCALVSPAHLKGRRP